MAAAVDVVLLSRHLEVPEDALSLVATNPTVDLVRAVLDAVVSKAREYDVLASERIQLDVELESVVRDSEARCRTAKQAAHEALKDAEELRRRLQEEGLYLCTWP